MGDFENLDWKALVIEYGTGLVKFIAVLLVGLWLAKMITGAFKRTLEKRDLDIALQRFLGSMVGTVLKVLVIITALGMLGIEMTSFIAILGAAGLAIGMALSGTLQNFAGGVLILLLKPFKIGDVIQAQGHTGVVEDIQIFNTILLTPDNKTVLIPNGPLANNDLVNFSTKGMRRVDMAMGIGYGESINEARDVLVKTMQAHPLVMTEPACYVGVTGHGASSVDLAVRCYCKTLDYWKVYFDIMEQGKIALDAAGIDIPYPQQVNHTA